MGDPKAAIDLLIQTDRPAEAALLARTYAPRFASISLLKGILKPNRPLNSRIPKALRAWRTDLESKSKSKTANLLADPTRGQDAELFEEGWEEALSKEEALYGKSTNGFMDVGPVLGGDSP